MHLTATAKRHRRSFTLVELLVVVAILGLLAAIVAPAVYMGLVRAKQAKIQMELASITAAFERYKSENGSYPPDFMGLELVVRQRIERHLSQVFPRRKNPSLQLPEVSLPDYLPIVGYQNPPYVKASSSPELDLLSPAEALVFWLRGFTADREHPLRSNYSMVPDQDIPYEPPEREAWFDFDESRLVYTDDGDKYPVYLPPGGMTAPYVYFDSRSYAVAKLPTCVGYSSSTESGFVKPYTKPYASIQTNQTSEQFVNPKKFQVISAGLDDDYGSFVGDALVKSFPNGEGIKFNTVGVPALANQGYVAADRDNLTNFSEGSLGDALPQ